MRWVLLSWLCVVTVAYVKQTTRPSAKPSGLGISDQCTLLKSTNETLVAFHDNRESLRSNRTASVTALNSDCSLVLFGYPEENRVVLWRPYQATETIIAPDFNVNVARFGHALDIQNQTWVVGAPGLVNDHLGHGATMGYAFVYVGNALHSCRSLYDTYCFPVDSTCVLGFKNMKDYYNLTDAAVPPFQKQCRTGGLPVYASGPRMEETVAYQQFGFDVVLTGQLHESAAGLFISAPGDTNRFMEDNAGQNFGRVYVWKSRQWISQNNNLDTIAWWEMSMTSPLKPPSLSGVTYRAFGRALAASKDILVVGTYPLYDERREPFVLIYNCVLQHCEESTSRGISVDDLPGNVLGYLKSDELSYTDGKTGAYIPANVDNDDLEDFQNNFIGNNIGVVGSNVVIVDSHSDKVYRFGPTAVSRETHPYYGPVGFGTNTQQWVHGNSDGTFTRLWNCPLGRVGGADVCTPCSTSYFSDDGWLGVCERCPQNYTTNETGQSSCHRWYAPVPPGLVWEDALFIMAMIVLATFVVYGTFLACECCSPARKKRQFVDSV